MQIIYKPRDLLEANMLTAMLANEDIQTFINGLNLQGGVGELPVNDLITIMVNDDNAKKAKFLINDYLKAKIVEDK